MADITEIAIAAWRLEKWLDNVNVERKMAAKSALRAIKKYLKENDIETLDLTGSKFDVGLAVSVVNNESDEVDEDNLIISEMVKPIIKERGAVIQYGQVILGTEVKKAKPNNVVEKTPEIEVIQIAASLVTEEKKEDSIAQKVIESPVETVTDELENVVLTEQNKNKKFIKMIAWASVIALQIIVILLLVKTMNSVNALQTKNQDNVQQVAMEESMENAVDLSGVETQLSDINDRLDSLETDVQGISEKLPEASDASEETEEYEIYTVQKGDTLISICSRYGINYYENMKKILEINNINDPKQLQIGQEIKLPKK